MADIDPEWVEVGAHALASVHGGSIDVRLGTGPEQMAAAVIAAVEPLIRRDVLSALLTKVEALPTWDGNYEPVVAWLEVLALFEEVAAMSIDWTTNEATQVSGG